MPFKSQAQRRWMYKNYPEMAKRWERDSPPSGRLTKRVSKKRSK